MSISWKPVLRRALGVSLLAVLVQAPILAYSILSSDAYVAKVSNLEFKRGVQLMDSVVYLYRSDSSNDHLKVVENYLSDVHSRQDVVCLNVFSQDGVINKSLDKSVIGAKVDNAPCGLYREDVPVTDALEKNRMCIQRPIFNSAQCNACHDSGKRLLGILGICVNRGPQEFGAVVVARSIRTSLLLALATAAFCFLVGVARGRNDASNQAL